MRTIAGTPHQVSDMRLPFLRHVEVAALVHPLGGVPKTAVFATGFEETRRVRVFPSGWNEKTARWRPTSVAGSLEMLRCVDTGGAELEHPLIVFTYDLRERVTECDRDWLWKRFGVPVFEQLLGLDNQLLAMECEAHDGLHLIMDVPHSTLERNVCACGSLTPRLRQRTEVYRTGPVRAAVPVY